MEENYVIQHHSPEELKQHKTYVWIMYAALGLSIVTGTLSAIAGLILAYVKRNDMIDTIYYNHACYLIKTFWIGFVASFIGYVAIVVYGIGFIILFLTFVWSVYRFIKGVVKLNEGKSISVEGWL